VDDVDGVDGGGNTGKMPAPRGQGARDTDLHGRTRTGGAVLTALTSSTTGGEGGSWAVGVELRRAGAAEMEGASIWNRFAMAVL
jgi:hypothetical protein